LAHREDIDEARSLLARLNEWQRMSGMPPQGKAGMKSLGESNAAIETLKRKLDDLGVAYRWSEEGSGWELVPVQSSKPDEESQAQ
jgi:hypothetical protein